MRLARVRSGLRSRSGPSLLLLATRSHHHWKFLNDFDIVYFMGEKGVQTGCARLGVFSMPEKKKLHGLGNLGVSDSPQPC